MGRCHYRLNSTTGALAMLINDAKNIVLKIIMKAIAKSVLIGRIIYIVKINPKIAVSIKLDGKGAGFQPLKNQVFFSTLFCFLLLELFLLAMIPITSFKYRKGEEYLKVTGIVINNLCLLQHQLSHLMETILRLENNSEKFTRKME